MPRRNRHRAARRIEARTKRNLLAVAAGAEAAAEPKKRQYSRHKSASEMLRDRGSILLIQFQAIDRLARDYAASGSQIGRLTARYDPGPLPPKRYQGGSDEPRAIDARTRFDAAMHAVGPWLSGILVHTAICDMAPTAWGPLNGRAPSHGIPVLLVALDALADHYAARRAA